MTGLTCPVCAGQLQETARQGILIDTCTRCRGVWLDRGELEKLSAAMNSGESADFSRSGDERRGFLRGAIDDLNGRSYRRTHDDDDDDRYRSGKSYKKRKSLLDFFD